MTPLAWLLGFLLPACGAPGALGLPPPAPFDIARIVRPASPNTALAAPAGFAPPPDLVTPDYKLAPDRLYAVLRAVAAARPRVFLAAEDKSGRHAQWVARSAVLNFPDLIAGAVLAGPGGGSRLVLYSRSVYGYSDLGANRRRVSSWLAAIDAATEQPAR